MKTLIALFLTLNCFFLLAQTEPRILILSPGAHKFHKVPGKELKAGVDEYRKSLNLDEADKYLQSPEFKKRPENIRLIQQSEIAFLKQLDEVKLISYLTEQHLSYLILEKLETAVIELKDQTSSGNVDDLKRIATQEKAAFVVNIGYFELLSEKGKSIAELTVQLFDANTGSILLDQAYRGDDLNPGFEYACEEGSVNCCINNALSRIVPQVGKLILANDPGMMKQKQLELKQDQVLKTLQETKFDAGSLSKVISPTDKQIEPKLAYQVMYSADLTKFVAFFAETVPAGDVKAFRDKHKDDKNINIISDDQSGFFSGALPNTYAYIVRGVLYKGKWYYEKSEVTYFDAPTLEKGKTMYFTNLRNWGFFTEGTTTPDPAFWEGTETEGYTLKSKVMFAKVPAAKAENGGMYRLVVDQMGAGK